MLPVAVRKRFGEDPIALMEREFDRMLRAIWGDGGTLAEPVAGYPVDISENDESMIVDAELPGFTREQINVSIDNNMLRIVAERQEEQGKGSEHLKERRLTKVERVFTLPAEVDDTRAEATLANGVLHLVLPKTGESKPRKIELK